MSARKIIDRIVESDDADAEATSIVAELTELGFDVPKEAESVRLSFDDDGGLEVRGPDEEDYVTYDVFPQAGFTEKWCRKHPEWVDISDEKRDQFEEIMVKHGYDLGSTGGHPPNVDYGKNYGNLNVTFAYWGNPFHV